MLEMTKAFEINGRQLTVNFPNVGQIIRIEALKQALTNNCYGAMSVSQLASAYYVLDVVDTLAFFQVMIPGLAEIKKIRNYADADLSQIQDIITAYTTHISPWYNKTLGEIRGITKPQDNESKERSE